ncbi:MAG TPA: hypothetical protein VIO94_13890 [Phenylobacterium sp.]
MAALPVTSVEGRSGSRRRTLLRGRICWGPHAAISADCTIRDLSADGAQLRLSSAQPIPQTFSLIHVTEGVAYEASLAWRRGDLAGVKFSASHDLKTPGARELFDLRQIWLAIAPA